jgi:hypothetical protein
MGAVREYQTMADVRAIPSERVNVARQLLVETAVALVIRQRLTPPARHIFVDRLAVALNELGGVIDGSIHGVIVEAERVVQAQRHPGAWELQHEAEIGLRMALQGFFAVRSDVALARLDGSDSDLIET